MNKTAEKKHSKNKIIGMLSLYSLLIVALLTVAYIGADLYRGLTASRASNENARGVLAYIQTKVQGADAQQAVRILESDYGDVLCLRIGETDFETRIFCSGGYLLEQTCDIKAECSDANAQIIASCTWIAIDAPQDDLFCFETEWGTAWVSLKSAGGKM